MLPSKSMITVTNLPSFMVALPAPNPLARLFAIQKYLDTLLLQFATSPDFVEALGAEQRLSLILGK